MQVLHIPTTVDAITALRTGYLLSAFAILVIYAVPTLRDRFLVYGPRDAPASNYRRPHKEEGVLVKTLDYFASIKVPHSWFKHFYMLSVMSSMVWLQQLYTRGPIFQKVLSGTSTNRPSMSFNQLVLCWTLLTIQGSRRLYESMILAKPTSSKMWVGHYLLGLLYYMAMGLAIWIEGGPALMSTDEPLGECHDICSFRLNLHLPARVPPLLRYSIRRSFLPQLVAQVYTANAPCLSKYHLASLHSRVRHLFFLDVPCCSWWSTG